MVQDETRQVAEYWDHIAPKFDSIYTGDKNPIARGLDKWLRRDMYERFDWVVRRADDCQGQSICDVGCGSGRFASALAQKGARVTGLDFAPTMLKLAKELVRRDGQAMPGAERLVTFQGENGNLVRPLWHFRPRGQSGKISQTVSFRPWNIASLKMLS